MNMDQWPEGWKLWRLGHLLADIQPGFACGEKSATEGIPHLRMNNINVTGKIDLSLVWHVPDVPERTLKYCLQKGDVLFNNTNSPALVGKTALFDEEGVYVYSNHLTRLRVKPLLLTPDWLALWLQYLWRRQHFESLCHRWINQAAVSREKLQELEIPLPPLGEQRRIVARIEELTRRIEEARGLRRTARQEAAAIMPAALAEVFGRAEEEWDAKRLPEVTGINPTYRLIADWRDDTPFPFVPMANISEITGTIVGFETRPLSQLKSGKTRFQSGDILFAKITPCVENGKVALAPQLDVPVAFASTEFHVVQPGPRLLPKFVWHFLRSKSVRDAAAMSMMGSTGRQRVPKEFMMTLVIPVPPLSEQRRIVAYLDGLQTKVEALHRLQEETQVEIAAMSGAALAKAFRGEL